MKSIKEQRELIKNATTLPWFDKPTPTACVVASTAYATGNMIYSDPPYGTFPAADQRFIISASENYPKLLDWAERARGYLESYIDDRKIYEGTEGLVTDMLKLLEELPE